MTRRVGNRPQHKPIHAEVLATAQRLSRSKDWTFKPVEVVRALPHLNEGSVRTHIGSRCCENAPKNHDHRWPYFHRVGRGVYKVLPAFRQTVLAGPASREECTVDNQADDTTTARDAQYVTAHSAIHAVIAESEGWYVAECLEAAVVTQGRTLDETLVNLRSALELHLYGEELALIGLPPAPRLVVSYETSAFTSGCLD